MKKLLFSIIGIIMLFGCSEEKLSVSDKVENDADFKVAQFDSMVVELNDSATTDEIKAVRYELTLFSKKMIPTETYKSYQFEIFSQNNHLESMQNSQNMTLLEKAEDGYLYKIPFETLYRNYNEEELKNLRDLKDFKLYAVVDNRKVLLKWK